MFGTTLETLICFVRKASHKVDAVPVIFHSG